MRRAAILLLTVPLAACTAALPPSPRAPEASGDVPFAHGPRAERPPVRVSRGAFPEVAPAVEPALAEVLEVQERRDAPPEAYTEAWCALAAVRQGNPYLSQAEQGCARWREYGARLAALRASVVEDVGTLLSEARRTDRTPEERLRVTDGFLRAYAPLASTPHAKVGPAVREALLSSRIAELEAGIVSRQDARSGLSLVWQPAPRASEGKPPAHPGFWLHRTEVTLSAYRACVRDGACSAPGEDAGCTAASTERSPDALPVTCVTREQAEAFCAWVGGRLPTLAEWRYAAQGGEGRPYPWGDTPPDAERAWFNAQGRPVPVALQPRGASRWGALGMAGNVAELVTGEAPLEVYAAGGSFRDTAEGLRADAAAREDLLARHAWLGFRCVE